MKKAYKFRFYPNEDQKVLLNKTFGCVRVVWNQALSWRTKEYEKTKKSVSASKVSRYLTSLKKR